MKTKLWVALFFLLFLIVFSPFGTVLSQDELEESTVFSIEVRVDGSATWIIERRFLLKTEQDVIIFQENMSEIEAQKEEYLEKFSNETRTLVDRASIITGRSMRAENFAIYVDILETASGWYGILKYRFDWIGFARVEDKRIVVGDVFEGGFYLYRDDTLIIKYPPDYTVKAVSPTPDDSRESDRTLTWYGRRNFGAGEPTVILQERTAYTALIIGIAIVAGIASAALLIFKRGKKRKEISGPPPWKAIEDDEDKVVALLRASGGVLYQSTITKKCRFSKSKTSELLISMEKKGKVKRKKKGREKLVTLIEGQKN